MNIIMNNKRNKNWFFKEIFLMVGLCELIYILICEFSVKWVGWDGNIDLFGLI